MTYSLKNAALSGAFGLISGIALTLPAEADIIVTNVQFAVKPPIAVTISAPKMESVYAGEFVLSSNIGSISAWCIDIFHDLKIGKQKLDFDLTRGLKTNGNGQNLTQAQINEMSWLIYTGTIDMAHKGTNIESAAIQIALWQLEYSGFSFTVKKDVTQVDSMETIFLNEALAEAHNNRYDHLIEQDNNIGTAQTLTTLIPEPGSLAMLGTGILGLAGAAALRRRRDDKRA